MGDLTRIIDRLNQGDDSARAEILEIVYLELREMAAAKLRKQPPGFTLNATALVHEAWMRIVPANKSPHFHGRRHFFAAASEVMKQVLVDAARRRTTKKRGGNRHRVPLESAEIQLRLPDEKLLQLDEALQRLTCEKPQVAELVKLRYFVGLTFVEAAQVLGVSERTAKNWWVYAKAWLYEAMQED